MAFEGDGRPLTDAGIARICTTLDANPPAVWAVLSVETSGFGFLPDRRPRILFERHIFHRRTGGRFDASDPDISHATRGGYVFGAGEYPRLERAIALEETAALESASWGVGQVMGFNFTAAGFADVKLMVNAMIGGEDAQLLAMANFIKDAKLSGALRNQDWTTFARGYNGPQFADNHYPEKLGEAYAKYQDALPNLRLRTAQAALSYLGFDPGRIDGLPGRRTRTAVRAFQGREGLPQTADLDPASERRLLTLAFPGP